METEIRLVQKLWVICQKAMYDMYSEIEQWCLEAGSEVGLPPSCTNVHRVGVTVLNLQIYSQLQKDTELSAINECNWNWHTCEKEVCACKRGCSTVFTNDNK